MYVPSTIAQIAEHVGAMVLCMPDMQLPNTDVGFEGAYEQLENGFALVRDRLGDEKYDKLMDMLRDSKTYFLGGNSKCGRNILRDMKRLLKG